MAISKGSQDWKISFVSRLQTASGRVTFTPNSRPGEKTFQHESIPEPFGEMLRVHKDYLGRRASFLFGRSHSVYRAGGPRCLGPWWVVSGGCNETCQTEYPGHRDKTLYSDSVNARLFGKARILCHEYCSAA